MIPISIATLADIISGQLYFVADPTESITAVSTDTRHIAAQSAFFALRGDRFDGHDFVPVAIGEGANVAVVSKDCASYVPQILVTDVEKALGQLAKWVRLHMSAKIVALTGSNGKTSVKEMTAAILQQCGKTLYTKGNFNNAIGVPLTLVRLTAEDKYAVIELGANHPGEIAYTTDLVQPRSVLINNIASAHLEGFGSLNGVANAKGEIFLGLPKEGGIVILNLDSYSPKWLTSLNQHSLYFFSVHSSKADYYASDIVPTIHGTKFKLHTPEKILYITLPLTGIHNVSNALAATALARSVGTTNDAIINALASLTPIKGRLYPIAVNDNQRIWDDTYNANASSMCAAIAVLARQPGYRVLVAGDMAELGADAVASHREVNDAARAAQIDCVLSIGNLSEHISHGQRCGAHFTEKSDLVGYLKILLATEPELTILVKGSRSMAMEQIIYALIAQE